MNEDGRRWLGAELDEFLMNHCDCCGQVDGLELSSNEAAPEQEWFEVTDESLSSGQCGWLKVSALVKELEAGLPIRIPLGPPDGASPVEWIIRLDS